MSSGWETISGDRRVLVLLDAQTAVLLPEQVAALRRQGAITRVVDYRHLMGQVDALRQTVQEHQIDLLLFSRNDQVFDKISIGPLIRALRVGYSSFSGIDTPQAQAQTKHCLEDYLAGGSRLLSAASEGGAAEVGERNSGRQPHRAGTCSLVFDLEQLGCARFGLPRILKLLDRFGAKATFFTTNFISEIYSDTLDILRSRGHEVGLHGQIHEYLAGLPLDRQIRLIREMLHDFRAASPVVGANFIIRMDGNTVRAMIANALDYFVVFMEHRYSPFAYRKMPLGPRLVWSPQGTIWMVPISVETNNRPWFAVRNMIDSARIAASAENWSHINVLLHPFRDGALRHIGDLERLLSYLRDTAGYTPIPLRERVKSLQPYEPSCFLYFALEPEVERPVARRSCWQTWWHQTARYQQRVHNLYQELIKLGERPALSLDVPAKGTVYAVYPHLPKGLIPNDVIEVDPLVQPQEALRAARTAGGREQRFLRFFVPKGIGEDLRGVLHACRPRFLQDYTGLVPETALRLAYRLTSGRHVF